MVRSWRRRRWAHGLLGERRRDVEEEEEEKGKRRKRRGELGRLKGSTLMLLEKRVPGCWDLKEQESGRSRR